VTKKATEVFDVWANDGSAEEMEDGHAGPVQVAVSQMDLLAGETILDLGCGNGWATRMLAGITSAPAIGIDGAPSMVERARQLSSDFPDITFEQASFEALPVESETIDRVFSMEALYYALDPAVVIAEIYRVLKSGGRTEIIVNFFRENKMTERWAEVLGVSMQWLGEDDWAELFRSAGFDLVETRRVADPKGPGREDEFAPEPWCPTWPEKVDFYEQGSLWVRAKKPGSSSG